MDQEMTRKDVVADPLIAILMRADGVDPDTLENLLRQTADIEVNRLQQQIRQARASEFYGKLDESAPRTGLSELPSRTI